MPAVVSVVWLFTVAAMVEGFATLAAWNDIYDGEGVLAVESCTAPTSSQVSCTGELRVGDELRRSRVVGPAGAFGTERPSTGERIPVYFKPSEAGTTYPDSARTTELMRAIVARLPYLFLFGGLGTWLVGWFLTRDISRGDAERWADHYRWPQRFVLRPRGALWALFGLAWLAIDRFLVDRLVGTVGLG